MNTAVQNRSQRDRESMASGKDDERSGAAAGGRSAECRKGSRRDRTNSMENDIQIYAGIVSFNPDIKKLKSNIDAVCPQADVVIVDDNGSDNISAVRLLCEQYPKLKLIENGENLGIAAALNILFRNAAAGGAQWLLTLDQDSCIDANFMDACRPYMDDPAKVSLSTLWRDSNTKETIDYDPSLEIQTVPRCITSGNLVRVSAWAEVGGFNEALFIDSVDHAFCYRLRTAGYEIHQINQVLMTHSLGDSERRRFIWRTVVVTNHSTFRKYYIYRNLVYMLRFEPLQKEKEGHSYKQLIVSMIKVLLYEDNKMAKVKEALRGIHDGLRMPEYVYPTIRLDEIIGMADADASVTMRTATATATTDAAPTMTRATLTTAAVSTAAATMTQAASTATAATMVQATSTAASSTAAASTASSSTAAASAAGQAAPEPVRGGRYHLDKAAYAFCTYRFAPEEEAMCA